MLASHLLSSCPDLTKYQAWGVVISVLPQNGLVSSTSVASSPTQDAPASNNYATHQNVSLDATAAIAAAAAASAGSWTIGLTASDETTSGLWKEFITPELTVTYNSIPATPTNQTFTPQAVTGGQFYTASATPTLSATVSDPNGGMVAGNFEVWAGNAATPTTKVASGTSADVRLRRRSDLADSVAGQRHLRVARPDH